jgi:hypothetical protein
MAFRPAQDWPIDQQDGVAQRIKDQWDEEGERRQLWAQSVGVSATGVACHVRHVMSTWVLSAKL